MDWIERAAPNVRDRGKELLPVEQIKIAFDHFCAGLPLHDNEDIRRLDRRDKGIWELKTLDVRLFGCFVEWRVFLITVVRDKATVKKAGYDVFVKEAVKVLDKLGIDRSYSENLGSLDDAT